MGQRTSLATANIINKHLTQIFNVSLNINLCRRFIRFSNSFPVIGLSGLVFFSLTGGSQELPPTSWWDGQKDRETVTRSAISCLVSLKICAPDETPPDFWQSRKSLSALWWQVSSVTQSQRHYLRLHHVAAVFENITGVNVRRQGVVVVVQGLRIVIEKTCRDVDGILFAFGSGIVSVELVRLWFHQHVQF